MEESSRKNRASAKEQTQSKHSMLGDSGGEQPKDGVSAKKQAQSENNLLEDAQVVFAKHRGPDAEEMFKSLKISWSAEESGRETGKECSVK